jgi:hypothetical protein
MGRYTRAISGHRLVKHVPAATDPNYIIEELCFLCGPCRDVISQEQDQFSPVRKSVKKGRVPEAEE